jgi:hypothetical protein
VVLTEWEPGDRRGDTIARISRAVYDRLTGEA